MTDYKEMVKIDYQKWLDHEAYMTNKRFYMAVPIWVDFYEGRQWKGVNSFPLGVKKQQLNFIFKTVNNKLSNILSQKITLMYESERPQFDNSKFNNYVKGCQVQMRYQRYKRKIVKDSGVKGTGFALFYWDKNAVSLNGVNQGAIKMCSVDMLNFACSDPGANDDDIQKQKWIMFRQKESIKSLREQCEIKDNLDLIKKGNDNDAYQTESTKGAEAEMIWSYTRMFRINGEVFFDKFTSNCKLYKEPKPFNPFLVIKNLLKEKGEEYKLENDWYEKEFYEIDSSITVSDKEIEVLKDVYDKTKSFNEKFSLYPITKLTLLPRFGSIYGISEVEGLIPAQIFVNYMFTMFGLDIQSIALGVILQKDKALRGQTISNIPGKVYTDYTPGASWGVKRLESTNVLSSGLLDTILKTIDVSRDLSSSKDLITSENINKDMSGYLYALLSADANEPLNDMVEELKNWEEDNGRVIEQFVKFFCEKHIYKYELNKKEIYNQEMATGNEVNPIQIGEFNGEDFMNTEFNVQVEAGQGYKVSEANTMQMIQTLFMNGVWDNMRLASKKFFLKFCPQELLNCKDDLEVELMKEEQSELAQKENEINSLKQLLAKADQTIKTLGEQSKYLSQYMKSQSSEFGKEIKAKDQIISSQDKAAKELFVTQDGNIAPQN